MKKVIFGLLTFISMSLPALAIAEIGDIEQKLTISNSDGYEFLDKSVAISGNHAIVGAIDNDSGFGSVHVFKRTDGTWREVAKLTASDGEVNDGFGKSVSISGDHVMVGADGDDDNGLESGSAYVFEQTGDTWREVAKLTASDGDRFDRFGKSVSISSDLAIIGAYQDDDNGLESGSAYVFEQTGDTWREVAKLTASDGVQSDWFGWSVSISGNHAIVGAFYYQNPDSNSAYVFERTDGNWREVAKLSANDGDNTDGFGLSVAISGNHAIVGDYRDEDNGHHSGSAYVFERTGGIWNKVAKLTASDGEINDSFGWSASISGNHAIVGAYGDDSNGYRSGSAYVFKRTGDNWREVAKLTASDGDENDWFGHTVAISRNIAIVGADDNDSNSISAYVYSNNHKSLRRFQWQRAINLWNNLTLTK